MRRSSILMVFALVVTACSGAGDPASGTPATVPTTTGSTVAGSSATSVSASTAPSTSEPSGGATTSIPPTATTSGTGQQATLRALAYEPLVSDVPFPIYLGAIPGTQALLIGSKDGRLWVHEDGTLQPEPFLDLRNVVRNSGEQGLLGVAFAPDFETSGRLFVHYTAGDGDTVVSEFAASATGADSASEQIVFTVGQPARNHNGGMLAFGPDDHLYLGLGDGGGANDRFGHGQNDATPLGALLRFDVSTPGSAAPAGGEAFDDEAVWSIGLRNPWRFAIDFDTGLILIADVGQNAFEEISAAAVDQPGLNYGWPITEGLHCFRPSSGCDTTGLTLPVVEVAHSDAGTCSITGGVVYRGLAIPELEGQFLFSDFCGGYLRSFPVSEPFDAPTDWTDQVGVLDDVASFGTDADGEVYVLTAGGTIYKIVAQRG